MGYHLIHKRSNVKGKTPETNILEFGELGVNYNTETPTIFLKNSDEKILSLHLDVRKISYSELKELKDNNNLSPNTYYRIIDYVTTTSQDNTISANHPFDLIVKALSTNTLSEDANAIIHDGDTYFTNNKLESWTIKYCLENDTTRFKWANVNGKGVIYYLKDEFNNEAWYDFKNIQFLRDATWLATNSKFTSASGLTTDTYFFTFSRLVKGVVYDDSLYTTNYHATDNHLGRDTAKTTKLNNTIFIDKENNGVFNNIIADGHGNNTFGQSIWNNTIGHNFKDNIINKSFQYNAIGERFEKNQCYGYFIYCNVEAYCVDNRFNGNVTNCTFGQTYYYNNFTGDTLSYCTFGSNISWVSDMPSMTNVEFSNKCVNGSSSIYLNNLTLDNGGSVLSALNALNGESKSILHKLDNGNYTLFSYSIDKVVTKLSKNVYDLGDFASSKEAEDAASNPNIATKKDILMMHYTVSSTNKSGIIRQQVSDLVTYQYIVWDGVEKRRVLRFVQLGSSISLIEKGDWEEYASFTVHLGNFSSLNDANNKAMSPQICSNYNIFFILFKVNNKTGIIRQTQKGLIDGHYYVIQTINWDGSEEIRTIKYDKDDNGTVTIQENTTVNLYQILEDKIFENEEVCSSSLNDLKNKITLLENEITKIKLQIGGESSDSVDNNILTTTASVDITTNTATINGTVENNTLIL